MTYHDFRSLLVARHADGHSVCVGLDSDLAHLPPSLSGEPAERQITFNRAIIESTAGVAAAFKLNSAFYEALGADGISAMVDTVTYCHRLALEVPVILDCKRGDIGSTNDGYAIFAYDVVAADAVTLHPYLGAQASRSAFLERPGKGAYVLCRTSNPGAGEFQDLHVTAEDGSSGPFFEAVARSVMTNWNDRDNCGLVLGATYPAELRRIRSLAPELPLLIPGVGAQGGDVEEVRLAIATPGGPCLVNSSRGIIFASNGPDFAEAAGRAANTLAGSLRTG